MITLSLLKFIENHGLGKIDEDLFFQKFFYVFTSTSTKSLETLVFIRVSRGGSEFQKKKLKKNCLLNYL